MTKPFASLPEVAELFGVSISTVRRRIAAGEIRVHRFGRQLRVERFDLARYIEQSRASDTVVIGDEADDANGNA